MRRRTCRKYSKRHCTTFSRGQRLTQRRGGSKFGDVMSTIGQQALMWGPTAAKIGLAFAGIGSRKARGCRYIGQGGYA